MYRNSNLKTILILLIVLTVSFSVGYAYLNTTLTINGTSTVQKNTWDTHFDNINIKEGSVVANVEPTVESGTKISRFDLVLQKPGDFYEFTVDVVNGGTLDAMVSNIVKTPNLTATQQKYLDYRIEYENGEEITKKQLVKVEEFVRVKVRVEYKKDLNVADLPTELELVTLGFEINYEQADENGISVENNGKLINIISGDGTNTGDEVCIEKECFYVMYSDEYTITMLSKYNLYVGNVGNVDSNGNPISTPLENPTGKQNKDNIGYTFDLDTDELYDSPWEGTVGFSNTNYWESLVSNYPSYVYNENSIMYSYIENYKIYLGALGVIPSEARLITIEELESFGCSGYSCSSAPIWIFSTTYWSGSAVDTNLVKYVCRNGYYTGIPYYYDNTIGVRPVIVIDKDLLQ